MTKRDMLQATATEKSSNEENAELTNVLQYLAPRRPMVGNPLVRGKPP